MAKKKKKVTKYYPQDFKGYKVIKEFKKPRSPRTRLFLTNDPDKWFIDVIEIKTKTGEVTDEEGWIIERDVKGWSDWYNRLGWKEES